MTPRHPRSAANLDKSRNERQKATLLAYLAREQKGAAGNLIRASRSLVSSSKKVAAKAKVLLRKGAQ